MQYYFFNAIADIKKYVGGGANLSVELASLEPGLHAALVQHVLPFIGSATWAELQAEADPELVDGAWTVDDADLSPSTVALLPYLRRALALLALAEYSKVNTIQMTEAGMMRPEGENMRTPYKYQENQYREFMLTNGYEALEQLVVFMDAHPADYATWYADAVGIRHRAVLLRSAELMRTHYSRYISRYTYETLRSLIEDVELFGLRSTLGTEQYEALLAMDSPTGTDAELIAACRKAVANYVVQEAMRRSIVTLDGNTLRQYKLSEAQSYHEAHQAATTELGLPSRFHTEWAERHMSRVLQLLTDNIEDYPLYAAKLEADAAAEAATAATDALSAAATTPNPYQYDIDIRSTPTHTGAVRL